MEKCFNIAGPCFPDEHYMLPALERLPGIMRIVEQRSYFVLHAARQSGKTTALMALVRELNGQGRMNALYFTVETVQRFTDPKDGIPKIVESMRNAVLRHPLFKDLVRDPDSEIPALRPQEKELIPMKLPNSKTPSSVSNSDDAGLLSLRGVSESWRRKPGSAGRNADPEDLPNSKTPSSDSDSSSNPF